MSDTSADDDTPDHTSVDGQGPDAPPVDPPTDQMAVGAANGAARRARFRQAIARISDSSSDELIRWIMIPASIAVIVGFSFILLGWVGASRTSREIEQIPYLISGGVIGLALVFLGGLMLASAFWVVVVRKMTDEADRRARDQLEQLGSRVEGLAGNGRSRRRRPLHPGDSTGPHRTTGHAAGED